MASHPEPGAWQCRFSVPTGVPPRCSPSPPSPSPHPTIGQLPSATAAPGDVAFASSFEAEPAASDLGEHARGDQELGGHRPGPGRHPRRHHRDQHRRHRERGERAERDRGQGGRRRREQQVAGLRHERMAPGELRAGRHGQALRPDQRERLARARPARLAGPGLQRQRRHLDHGRQQDRAELRPAVPDQGVRGPDEHHRLRRIPAQRHREPERRHHPARRVPPLRRQPRRPAERADGRRGRQRADQRLQRQDRRRLHRPQGAPVCGSVTGAAGGKAWDKVYDVDIPVGAKTELSYRIFPELTKGDLRYPSTYASVDLAFTDGTYLSDLPAVDQLGFGISPRAQGTSKALYANQWNPRSTLVGAVAAGKTIDRILVGYDNPAGPADFGGWIDDLVVREAPPVVVGRPSDHVVTTRGTQSNGQLLAGQQLPGDRRPAGLQLLDPGDRRRARRRGCTSTTATTTRTTARASRRSRRATSRARGWPTATPSS